MGFLTYFFFFSQLPLAGLIRNSRLVLLVLIAVHVAVVMAVLVTPLGHPYTGSSLSGDVRPQRVQILVWS